MTGDSQQIISGYSSRLNAKFGIAAEYSYATGFPFRTTQDS